MNKTAAKAPTQNVENIAAAVGRMLIDGEATSEIIVVAREAYKDTTADLRQKSVVRFSPVVIHINSTPDSSSYNAPITIGHLVPSATIAAAAAQGAYAFRLNVLRQTGVMSNLNNEVSGSYDQLLVGTNMVSGGYYYQLNNVRDRAVAEGENMSMPIFETNTMPINQATSTVLYNASFDFNQVRAMASNVSADMTLDMSVEVEVIFSYGVAPTGGLQEKKKESATARKFF